MYDVAKRVDAYGDDDVRLGRFQWHNWIVLHRVRSKAKAIELANEVPTLAVVNITHSSEVVHRNGKAPEVNYGLAHSRDSMSAYRRYMKTVADSSGRSSGSPAPKSAVVREAIAGQR